jgi:hypothetical protein
VRSPAGKRRLVAVLAALLLAASITVLATGGWYLECTQGGTELGGIDCFQDLPGSLHAGSEPAQTTGWVIPLVVAGSASILLLGLGMQWLRRRGRSGVATSRPSAGTRGQ